MPMHAVTAALAAALLAVSAPAPALAENDPLAALRWSKRVLLVFADDRGDPTLAAQRRLFEADPSGTAERDFVLVEAIGGAAGSSLLRRRFGVADGTFRAILIGKDGGGKLSSRQPLSLERLYREIDAMPMRRQEMRERS